MTKTQELEVVAGLAERLLMSAVDMERKFLHRIDHSGEDWRLVNPNGETAAALMREAQSVLLAAEAERDALRKALEPFAEAGAVVEGSFVPALFPDDAVALGCTWTINGERRSITWSAFRAARKALEASK